MTASRYWNKGLVCQSMPMYIRHGRRAIPIFTLPEMNSVTLCSSVKLMMVQWFFRGLEFPRFSHNATCQREDDVFRW